MRALVVQPDIVWENPAANRDRLSAWLTAAAPEPGSLVALPELCLTGFSLNVAAIADNPQADARRWFAALARAHRSYLLAGLATRDAAGKGRNQAVAFAPEGNELAAYTKQRSFTFAGEDQHYRASDQPVVFGCHGFTVAPLICYDLRFPELFRAAVGLGADLFVVIANWPAPRAAHWSALLRARAIENQAYVIGVNRCGRDPEHEYAGGSLVIDPQGETLAAAGAAETILTATLDPAAVADYRARFPALRDAGLVRS